MLAELKSRQTWWEGSALVFLASVCCGKGGPLLRRTAKSSSTVVVVVVIVVDSSSPQSSSPVIIIVVLVSTSQTTQPSYLQSSIPRGRRVSSCRLIVSARCNPDRRTPPVSVWNMSRTRPVLVEARWFSEVAKTEARDQVIAFGNLCAGFALCAVFLSSGRARQQWKWRARRQMLVSFAAATLQIASTFDLRFGRSPHGATGAVPVPARPRTGAACHHPNRMGVSPCKA